MSNIAKFEAFLRLDQEAWAFVLQESRKEPHGPVLSGVDHDQAACRFCKSILEARSLVQRQTRLQAGDEFGGKQPASQPVVERR